MTNHSSDISTKYFTNIYIKCTVEPYSFLVNDQIKDEKLQYDINREAAKISALSSGKIHKYEYLTGEDILPSNQQQIIEQARFTYSPLGKAFQKKIKTIENQQEKQIESSNTLKSNNQLTIKDVIPKNPLNNDEAKKEFHKIKEIEKNVDRKKLIYKTNEYTYSFENFQTIKTFGRDVYEGKITIKEDLLVETMSFKKHTKPRSQEKKNKKNKLFVKTCINFGRVEKKFLMLLKAKYF